MTQHQDRLLLIGGYPKGYDKPFDERTLSGRRLKVILNRNNLEPKIIDLWDNQKQEQDGEISPHKIKEIDEYILTNWRVIALGRWVYKCLSKHCPIEYLPHPASRKKKYLELLERGLVNG